MLKIVPPAPSSNKIKVQIKYGFPCSITPRLGFYKLRVPDIQI